MQSQGILHKICNIYCDDAEQRKDLSQEILIQLWKSYSSFRGDAKFSSWMYRVALNVALQHLRKKKRSDSYSISDDLHNLVASTSESEILEENIKQLHHAIKQLNDIEKAIIMLYLDGKKHEEIAEIVGITQNYVRVKMNRIKEKLRKTLTPEPHGA